MQHLAQRKSLRLHTRRAERVQEVSITRTGGAKPSFRATRLDAESRPFLALPFRECQPLGRSAPANSPALPLPAQPQGLDSQTQNRNDAKEHQESKAQGNYYAAKCRFISLAQRTRGRPIQSREETRRKEARVDPSLSHFPTSPRRTNGGGEETNSHLCYPNHSTRILRRRDQATPSGQRSDETEPHSSTSAHSGRRRNPKDQL